MTEVLGRPVTGTIPRGYRGARPEQWGAEEFLPLLDAVLAAGVESVKWHQYTPSFNDGEPCEFTVGEFRVRPINADEDSEEGEYEDGFLTVYDIRDYSGGYRNAKAKPGFEAVYEALTELDGKSGHFEVFLEDTFGNGSQIVATAAGFEVDYYDCGY